MKYFYGLILRGILNSLILWLLRKTRSMIFGLLGEIVRGGKKEFIADWTWYM